MTRRLQLALALAALAAALPCAHAKDTTSQKDVAEASRLYLAGARALDKKDYSTAESDFNQAAQLEPGNPRYASAHALLISQHATALIQAAEKARILGHSAEARADMLFAYRIDPNNPMLAQHLDEIADASAPPAVELYPQDNSYAPPVALTPAAGTHSFHIHAPAGELLQQVLQAYGITPAIDESVIGQPIRFDADNVSFDQAAQMARYATNTFFVPLDPKRVLVASDTKDNRKKFERLAYETVYLPGLTDADLTDIGAVVREVFQADKTTISPEHHTLSVRAPQSDLAVLNSTLREMLDGHSIIQIDVRLYNIARTNARNIGVQLPQQVAVFNIPSELRNVISQNQALVDQIISSGLARPGDLGAIALALLASGQISGSSILSQPFAYFGGGLTLTGISTSSITGNLSLNSSDSRAIDRVTMRLLDKQESTIKAGERYPIITSSYSNFSGSGLGIPGLSSAGLSSQLASLGINPAALTSSLSETIPQVQYQDLGLTLKVKPFVAKDRDVTLNMELKITSLQGTSINNIPVLNNQDYSTIATLKPGASALLVSDLSKQQSQAIDGVPGLSELPGFGSTTNKNTNTSFSDLVILITPHIVRLAHHYEAGKMFVLPVH